MSAVKIFMLLGVAGHLLCRYCDVLLTVLPGGRFSFDAMQDNQRLAALFAGADAERARRSALGGVLAMALFFCAYAGLAWYLYPSAPVSAGLMGAAAVVMLAAGAAHHVFCAMVEWFYLRLSCTEEARAAVLDFFKKTALTMYVYYAAMLVFCVVWFVSVVTGAAGLPVWACVFNTLPLFLVLSPFKPVGAGNLAGALMFWGLLFLL